ncbi:MAG: hypothetical protein HY900_07860 [Deltaproteobacteria bacterium]|nr:hypothetical protein [Deltaproteobacteria bacterium]
MTRAHPILACALLGVVLGAAAQEPAPVPQVRMTCRMAKNVPPGTRVRVSMRSKYTHFQDPKDVAG